MADFFAAFGTIINTFNFLGSGLEVLLFGFIFALTRAVTKETETQEPLVWIITMIIAAVWDFPVLMFLLVLYIYLPLIIKTASGITGK